MRKLKIVLAQVESTPGNIDRNLDKIRHVVESYDGDLYVFPELFLQGYHTKDYIVRVALDTNSHAIGTLRKIAVDRGIGLIVGFAERASDGLIYNAALCIDESGNTYVYRKRHLPTFTVFEEGRWYCPGRGRIDVWVFRDIKVGVAICYDIFFPEIFRIYALKGAALLVILSASPDASLPLFDVLTRARALENTCFLAWVNNVGVFDGLGYAGGSRLVDPLGNVVLQLKRYEEDVGLAEIEIDRVTWIRSVVRPVLRDLRLDDALQLLAAYEEVFGVMRAVNAEHRL